MNTLNFTKTVAALALLGAMGSAQAVVHEPSPCQAAEPGAGLSCVYTVPPGSVYQMDGTRDGVAVAGTTISIDIWIDFRPEYTTGGGFDVTYEDAAVDSISFAFDSGFDADTAGRTTGTDDGMGLLDGIGFAAFNSLGGEDNDPQNPGGDSEYPGFQLMGTLTVALSAAFTGMTDFLFIESTSTDFPSNFVGGDDFSSDIDVNFFGSTIAVAPVPLPAAAWMMLSGLGVLFGFGRKKLARTASA
jgi:hypothetical protein